LGLLRIRLVDFDREELEFADFHILSHVDMERNVADLPIGVERLHK